MSIFLKAKWTNIIMANYAINPSVLAPYLPYGVELDLFEGKAYVSLVGFMFENTRIFNLPVPLLGTFEEVNLRFYVKRTEGNIVKRGVVFINETVPYKLVAWIANALYKESYTCVPTKHTHTFTSATKQISYAWFKNKQWNNITVDANIANQTMVNNSCEQFIFEHYYGYTKISETETEEYKINHPSWLVNTVTNHNISCDFKAMYGNSFEFLNSVQPTNIFIAEGSAIEVEWKRNKIKA
jgi:uncharacterized protein